MDLSSLPKKKLEEYASITRVPVSQIYDFEDYFLDRRDEAMQSSGAAYDPKKAKLPKFKVYAQVAEDEWYCVDTSGGDLKNASVPTMGDAVTFLEYGEYMGGLMSMRCGIC